VIIANPNGISCSGCSFINTNSAVLTTGQVKLNDNGGIGSYTVSKGKITIGKNGMDATNNYAPLLAETIAINGTLSAANATLGAGSFTFD
ncbi:two-partner secretion domain-containing protein, partial [Klebsiella pneumoniae]|uniref:two-partner secretion domain-containing protein n=1 Tax=Klebsiella pneumoniae TaxID=573 RepID=UPI00275C50B3|nr:filamentous hemagglutinin [Klebsiella pneumoniae]